ncbi:DUF2637 domain-containing protein [Streptomyces sp. NPDC050625]|uniref:DUF2637 domain-containing protein n=1 Tax=Streptomyces sp. NPDC050625 TaxID=3154629 RepID=UPI00341EE855
MNGTRAALLDTSRRHTRQNDHASPVHGTPNGAGPTPTGNKPTHSPATRRTLTRAQRATAIVVTIGAVIVAGIGFAGSYAAVRELALKKGFGNFSYLFPVGIDAGICVLLALDLLLTWIRIPFPLLRQTAWVLTAATIAFNGAAAWPNPLGVGMHAVIPVLFVIAVEAARHAIGRIADITADKHMEGVRLTRWMLSPVPTFLLWRRMKLWGLRSYEQVIKLEQERLVYQARLQARFGRAWRRKAPIESLMPLRLARYGIPLAETAPAGLAAAGISGPPLQFTGKRIPLPAQQHSPAHEAALQQGEEPVRPSGAEPQPADQPRPADPGRSPDADTEDEGATRLLADASQPRSHACGIGPPSTQFTPPPQGQHGIATPADGPSSGEQPEPLLHALKHRHAPSSETETEAGPHDAHGGDDTLASGDSCSNAWAMYAAEHGPHPDTAAPIEYEHQQAGITGGTSQPVTAAEPHDHAAEFHDPDDGTDGTDSAPPAENETAGAPTAQPQDEPQPDAQTGHETAVASTHTAPGQRSPSTVAKSDDEPPRQEPPDGRDLTVVDRYYLTWMEHQTQHGSEPSPDELSALLANKGMLGRGRKPISPSTLRRYPLQFRIYTIWSEHRARTTAPSADAVAQECTARAITAQYNKPITPAHITDHTPDFERRWHTLTRHHAQTH